MGSESHRRHFGAVTGSEYVQNISSSVRNTVNTHCGGRVLPMCGAPLRGSTEDVSIGAVIFRWGLGGAVMVQPREGTLTNDTGKYWRLMVRASWLRGTLYPTRRNSESLKPHSESQPGPPKTKPQSPKPQTPKPQPMRAEFLHPKPINPTPQTHLEPSNPSNPQKVKRKKLPVALSLTAPRPEKRTPVEILMEPFTEPL